MQTRKWGTFQKPHLNISILEPNSAHLQARGVREPPQALVACGTYLWSHCKLKIVSPVGVILQLIVGKGGSLTVVKAAWATASVLHVEALSSPAGPSDSQSDWQTHLVHYHPYLSTPLPHWAEGAQLVKQGLSLPGHQAPPRGLEFP